MQGFENEFHVKLEKILEILFSWTFHRGITTPFSIGKGSSVTASTRNADDTRFAVSSTSLFFRERYNSDKKLEVDFINRKCLDKGILRKNGISEIYGGL